MGSDGLGVDLNAAASQLSDALNGSTDATQTTAPVADSTPAPVSDNSTPQQQTSGHPAWNEILSQIPASLHESIKPKLESWDRGVQQKLQEVHAQYDPYKDFVQMPVDQLQASVQLFHILNTNPELLYRELHGTYGQNAQGQNADEGYDPYEEGQQTAADPRIEELAQQQQMIMQQMQAAQEAQLNQQASQWLDSKVSEIETTFKARGIEPDMRYILGMAAIHNQQNPNADQETVMQMALRDYEAVLSHGASARTASANAPQVMSPNGAVPSSNFDPSTLNSEQRRKIAGELLSNAFKES